MPIKALHSLGEMARKMSGRQESGDNQDGLPGQASGDDVGGDSQDV